MMPLTMLSALAAQNGDEKVGILDGIIVIVFFFIVEWIYHEIFDVVYVGSGGCWTEIFVSFIIAVVLLILLKRYGGLFSS